MLELADEDEGLAAEIAPQLDRLQETLEDLELKALLSGPHDANNAILSINARDGGTDANDGPRCCCGCTCIGPRITATKSNCSTGRTTNRPASTTPR